MRARCSPLRNEYDARSTAGTYTAGCCSTPITGFYRRKQGLSERACSLRRGWLTPWSRRAEELSERRDAVGIGRDVKDDILAFLGDLPVSKSAALALGRGKRVEFLAYTILGSVANDKLIPVAACVGMTPYRHGSPAQHPRSTIIGTERARDRELASHGRLSAGHCRMIARAD